MKKAKWICCYAFFALLIGAAVAWCVYFHNAAGQVEDIVNSPEYIDIALGSFDDALEQHDRIDYLISLRNAGIIVGIILIVLLIAVVIWNVKGDKIVEEVKKKIKPKAKKGAYCAYCGQYYEKLPKFCGKCGQPTKK